MAEPEDSGRGRRSAKPGHPRARTPASPDADVVAAQQALERLDRIARRRIAALKDRAPEVVLDELSVPLVLSASGGGRAVRARELVERLGQEAREALRAAAAWQRGRLYCLRCENTVCEHALPPSPRHVFRGYGQTGRAEWIPFHALLGERQDPRLDALFLERHELLTLVVPGRSLYERLLPGFEEHERRHRILAQLCAGYFRPAGADPRGERMAVTVQVVRSPGLPQDAVVGVHVIGRAPADAGVEVDAAILEGLAEALAPLRRELEPLAGKGPGRRPAPQTGIALERLSRRCLERLRDAGRDLEHRRRVERRRTRHAQDRSRQGDRPTAKAFEDARAAPAERCLEDRRDHTVVVLGSRGRVHVFTREGRHVTSAVYSGNDIRTRTERKRWVPLRAEALAEFKQNVRASRE